jgi:hypothetical protein
VDISPYYIKGLNKKIKIKRAMGESLKKLLKDIAIGDDALNTHI